MGTVKYTGPVASFHCPTNAEIRSLKVHFSPKQDGNGDPSPENVRPIVGWDGVEAYDWTSTNASTSSVPSEYKKVEYLESTGTQYIYTNVPGRYGIECRAKVSWTSSGDVAIFGARKAVSDRIMLIHQYPSNRWTLGYGASYTGLSWIDFNTIYDVESKACPGEQYLKINGTTVYTGTDSTEYSNNFNMSLFACTNGSSSNINLKSSARIYSLSAKLDDVDVLNVVPCLRKSDNKPGMYDTVSQTFYTNAGTGEFLYGPEVSGYTEDYEFGVLGKNKLPITANMEIKSVNTGYNNTLQRDMTPGILYPNVSANNYWLGTSAKTFVQEVQNGSITFQANDGSYGIGTIVSVQPQTTYTISYTTSDNQVRMRTGYYDADGYFTGTHQIVYNGTSFTIPNGVYHMIIVATPNTDYYNQSITVSNLQLELGSTTTTYEPYDPNHTVYGGWVDLISGEVCEEYYKHTLDGTEEGWKLDGSGDVRRRTYIDTARWNIIAKPKGKLYINYCRTDSTNIWYAWISSTGSSTSCHVLFFVPATIDTVDKWVDFLSENPLSMCYELATPTTYHIAPTALQTFLGHNNVWSNADYVEVEYDLHETQSLLQRKAFIMANQPHIVKPAAASLQNFKTDVIAPLKECKVHFSPVQDLHGYDSPWPAGGGKNLFDEHTVIYKTWTASDGSISVSSGCRTIDISVVPNDTYTLFYQGIKPYSMSIVELDENKTFITRTHRDCNSNNVQPLTVNLTENTKYIYAQVSAHPDTVTFEILSTLKMQLEKGSTATSYVPYENVCPIGGWTGLNVFTPRGINLWDEQLEQGQYNSIGSPTDGSNQMRSKNLIPVEPDTEYYCYIDANINIRIYFCAENGGVISYSSLRNTTFTTPSGCKWLKFHTGSGYGTTYAHHISINHPATETGYHAFETVYPVSWTSSGTVYGGYVDLASGEVWKTHEKINLPVTAKQGTWDSTAGKGAYWYTSAIQTLATTNDGVFCNRCKTQIVTSLDDASSALTWYANGIIRWIDIGTMEMTVAEYRDYLAENPLQVTYKLSSPVLLTTLTPTQLKTLRGTNNIWSDANGNIELAYWSH